MNSENEFEYNGNKYSAVDDMEGECHKCCFFSKIPCFDKPDCTAAKRKDHKNVVFVRVD